MKSTGFFFVCLMTIAQLALGQIAGGQPLAYLREATSIELAPSIENPGWFIHVPVRPGDGPGMVVIDETWEVSYETNNQSGLIFNISGNSLPPVKLNAEAFDGDINLEMAVQRTTDRSAVFTILADSRIVAEKLEIPDPRQFGALSGRMKRPEENDGSATIFTATREQSATLKMNRDFTIIVRFRTSDGGTLVAKAPPAGEWEPDGRSIFVQGASLVYDIGWLGAMRARGRSPLNDGNWHTAVVSQSGEITSIYLDGRLAETREDFSRPDDPDHVFKIGNTSANFPDRISAFSGQISHVSFLDHAIPENEIPDLNPDDEFGGVLFAYRAAISESSQEQNQDREYSVRLEGGAGKSEPMSWVQPLSNANHARLIRSRDESSLARGERIYQGLCFACHGTPTQKGTLPTSRPFWSDPFKNGHDPYSLYRTITGGYNQMPAQPWLSPDQAYDVIHFIREKFVRPHNPGQYFQVDEAYLSGLPRSFGPQQLTREQMDYAKGPKYLRMDFGPMLNWTFQVAPDNIAYKGIAIRLDNGPGGVSRGRAWMVYDHDTMRVAAAWSGREFIDWKGIAFDQSHGTHTSIRGDVAYVNPVGPGWADPESGDWVDPRFLGRDGKPYGPLPRKWVQFKGQYLYGDKVVLDYTVGGVRVLESPSLLSLEPSPVFVRNVNMESSPHRLLMRVAPESLNVHVVGDDAISLTVVDGFHVLEIPASDRAHKFHVIHGRVDPQSLVVGALALGQPEDLSRLLNGGPETWREPVITSWSGGATNDSGAFVSDELELPIENPWGSWMRLGGFDFISEDRAAVATWLGDVWLVDGIGSPDSQLKWRRIATGLFQPLGVKFHQGTIFVTCRDQLARLHDLNGDEQIDHIECFNNDHQVTEHFHEFAMGLQIDDEGNFYYAKSARHALKAIVPHHGTLLRISPDGSRTDILASGFRAANGVCLNPDGSFIVTDQEGHWNPKNRINYVREGGFYGNMFGYHDVTDSSNEAMEQPLCWITNAFDRSPGELLWVPGNAAWGPFNGQLLNLSYGTGRAFLVPHEILDGQAQGGMVSLGLDFPTGIMRGRFHPDNGQLYTTGMFAWAGNKHVDGGFYRIRYTEKNACLPVGLEARQGGVVIHFSDPIDAPFAGNLDNYSVKSWDLVRSRNYGSPHKNERTLKITGARILNNSRSLMLEIPGLAPTWGMEITLKIKSPDGQTFTRIIHNSIHRLTPSDTRF